MAKILNVIHLNKTFIYVHIFDKAVADILIWLSTEYWQTTAHEMIITYANLLGNYHKYFFSVHNSISMKLVYIV